MSQMFQVAVSIKTNTNHWYYETNKRDILLEVHRQSKQNLDFKVFVYGFPYICWTGFV
jgi:hypothetical protein